MKIHKFSYTGAKPLPQRKLQALRENIFKTIFPGVPGESHVYSHRRKALQNKRRIVIRVEIFYQINDPENAQILPQWGHKSDMFTNVEIVKYVENIYQNQLPRCVVC